MSWSFDDLPWWLRVLMFLVSYWKWIVAAILAIGTGYWFLP